MADFAKVADFAKTNGRGDNARGEEKERKGGARCAGEVGGISGVDKGHRWGAGRRMRRRPL